MDQRQNFRRKTDVVKEAIKEATKEWMEEKYKQVGRWTVSCGCVFIFYLFVKVLFYYHVVDLRQLLMVSTEMARETPTN